MADVGPVGMAEPPWLQCFKAQLAPSVTAKSWYEALPSRGVSMWRSKGDHTNKRGGMVVFFEWVFIYIFFFAGRCEKRRFTESEPWKIKLGKLLSN